MRSSIGLKLSAVVALVIVGVASSAHAALNFSGSYAENFDSIGPTGTAVPTGWTIGHFSDNASLNATGGNGKTIVSEPLVVNLNDGTVAMYGGTNGVSYNYGTVGAADRAIGNLPRTPLGDHVMQVDFINTTGAPITQFSVSFAGEQWLDAQNTTPSSGPEKLRFFYSPSSAVSGFVAETALDFLPPVLTPQSAPYVVLDGNLAANRAVLSASITPATAIPVNGTFSLRWLDWNDSSTLDNPLAIDDLVVSATVSPEPASLALLGLGAVALLKRRRH